MNSTFQFTYSRGKILTLNELKEPIELKATVVVENEEGVYIHGKINAVDKPTAETNLEWCMQNLYPIEIAARLVAQY